MFTIRTDAETDEMISFLRNHKVKFTPRLKKIIKDELKKRCDDFKMKQKRIKNAPSWLYD